MGKSLSGTSLSGTSTKRERVDKDYYATPPESTKALLDNVEFSDGLFLEPCVGGGHIAEVIKERYKDSKVLGCDLVDRGYPNTVVADFLKEDFSFKVDNVITNPPYSLAQEFLEKSMKVTKPGGKIAMFLKINFLEGVKRKKMFEEFPPEYIYVFTRRQNPWRNGSSVDENGKKWSSTMCFAWFVWNVGYKGDPKVRWL